MGRADPAPWWFSIGGTGLALAILWCAAVTAYSFGGGSWVLPVFSLAIFGILLAGVTLAIAPRSPPEPIQFDRPSREVALAAAYVALFALLVLGWAFSWVREAFASTRLQEIALLLLKCATMVAIPLMLMNANERRRLAFWAQPGQKPRVSALAAVLGAAALTTTTLVMGVPTAVQSLAPSIGELIVGALMACLWAIIGAALAEEVLFRAYLQPRLTAAVGHVAPAVALGAILFALVHVPGLYLRADQADLMRDGSPSLLACVAYAIAVLAPPGFLFGLIWERTRSVPLLVLVHALIDIPPTLVSQIVLWR